jgi:hypothetical protein
MSAWQLFIDLSQLGLVAAILAVLDWAGSERARIHAYLRDLAEESRLRHWCAAMGTFAGCA